MARRFDTEPQPCIQGKKSVWRLCRATRRWGRWRRSSTPVPMRSGGRKIGYVAPRLSQISLRRIRRGSRHLQSLRRYLSFVQHAVTVDISLGGRKPDQASLNPFSPIPVAAITELEMPLTKRLETGQTNRTTSRRGATKDPASHADLRGIVAFSVMASHACRRCTATDRRISG